MTVPRKSETERGAVFASLLRARGFVVRKMDNRHGGEGDYLCASIRGQRTLFVEVKINKTPPPWTVHQSSLRPAQVAFLRDWPGECWVLNFGPRDRSAAEPDALCSLCYGNDWALWEFGLTLDAALLRLVAGSGVMLRQPDLWLSSVYPRRVVL